MCHLNSFTLNKFFICLNKPLRIFVLTKLLNLKIIGVVLKKKKLTSQTRKLHSFTLQLHF